VSAELRGGAARPSFYHAFGGLLIAVDHYLGGVSVASPALPTPPAVKVDSAKQEVM